MSEIFKVSELFKIFKDKVPETFKDRLSELPICVLQYLMTFLDFKSKMRFRRIAKRYQRLKIFKIPSDYKNLTEEILRQHIYLEKLDIDFNEQIKDISYLINLKKCNAHQSFCDKFPLSLEKLNLMDRLDIVDVSYLTNLKYLDIWDTNITNNLPPNIEYIDISYTNITDTSYLSKLKICNAYKSCCKIFPISLIELDIDKTDIEDISYLINLKKLSAKDSTCKIFPTSLEELDIDYRTDIEDISYLTNLKIVHANYSTCSIFPVSIEVINR